jgi:hypothetical protein
MVVVLLVHTHPPNINARLRGMENYGAGQNPQLLPAVSAKSSKVSISALGFSA